MGKKAKRARRVDALTKQQEKFCRHYALHGNGAEAYHHAYPASRKHTPKYRGDAAAKLIQNTRIRARIAELANRAKEVVNKTFDISAERVLEEIAAIAFQNSEDMYEWGTYEREVTRKDKESGERVPVFDRHGNPVIEHVPYSRLKPSSELTRQQKAAIISVGETISRTGERVIEPKHADKLGALKMLAQFNKLLNQQIDHKVALTGKDGEAIEIKDVSEVKKMDAVSAMKAFEAFRTSISG